MGEEHARLLLAALVFGLWLSALLFGVAGSGLLAALLALALLLVPWRAIVRQLAGEACRAAGRTDQSRSEN